MTVYSVFEPAREAPDVSARAEALAFVKEGFSWPALFVPLLWLLYQRMWLELIVLVLLLTLLQWASVAIHGGEDLISWATIGLIVLFAFEANDLRQAALVRRGYRPLGLAMGRSREAAELSFFDAWLPQQEKAARPVVRGDSATAQAHGGSEPDDVIGLFPGS